MSIKVNDSVRLMSKPEGHLSKNYPMTVGAVYVCLGFMGSNIITTTDDPTETASYHIGRVLPV